MKKRIVNKENIELYKTSYKISTSSSGITCYQSVLTKECPLHSHDYFEVEWITEGSCQHFINDKEYFHNKNSYWILDNLSHHRLIPFHHSKVNINNIRIYLPDTNDNLKNMFENRNLPLVGELPDRKRLMLDLIFKTLNEYLHIGAPPYVLQSTLTLILFELFSQQENSTEENQTIFIRNYITKALNYINENFKENIQLKDVAEDLHLSPNYLCTLFSQMIGTTFNNYLNNTRINYAKHLLANTNISIIDIAYTSGFGSVSTMSRNFRKYLNLSPREYRNKKKVLNEKVENNPKNS